MNATYLIADDVLSCDDCLTGLSVLRHLRVDTGILLENSVATLDKTDYSEIRSVADRGGRISGLMIARLSLAEKKDTYTDFVSHPNRHHVN